MQADLNLRWAHLPEGIFTDFVGHLYFIDVLWVDIYALWLHTIYNSKGPNEKEQMCFLVEVFAIQC